jgi:hypothetical protein
MPQEPSINTPQKGLVTDLHENYMSKELWSYARNAQTNSHNGQLQFLQNEPSNFKCADVPYKVLGFVKILNFKWVIFSSDDVNSEIGIFSEVDCTYDTLINDKALNFSTSYPVMGASKENFDCTETVYWTDIVNPRRYLNLSHLPLDTKGKLIVDDLLIDHKVSVPKISGNLTSSGNLKNGSYQFSLAYVVNNTRVTEFYSVSNPIFIWSHDNQGRSIDLNIENLDSNYEGFELGVIYAHSDSVSYYSLGHYPVSQAKVLVSSIQNNTVLSLPEIIVKRPRYPHADLVAANDHFLLWGGVRTNTEINYQKDAMNIHSEYVVLKVPASYYKNGGNIVGYDRDEVYSFGIQWLHTTGEWSPVYHIPGRKAEDSELSAAAGKDTYEANLRDQLCDVPEIIPRWQTENTAKAPNATGNKMVCNQAISQTGTMGYWESTDLYPNSKILLGADAGTPIRHHKMPDNALTHVYETGGNYINILGVQFKNIQHPLDSSGKERTDIAGFRIVRGNRKGHRSVIAKGLATNVRSYRETANREVLYNNYPFNDLRPDSFISSEQTVMKTRENFFKPLSDYKTDQFNFYAPHSLFRNVSLGDEVKFLTEEYAKVRGNFEKPYQYPKQKLLSNGSFYIALVIGAIDGYLATRGKKCITKFTNGTINVSVAGTSGAGTTTFSAIGLEQQQMCDDAVNGAIAALNSGAIKNQIEKFALIALKALAGASLFTYFAARTAQKILDDLYQLVGWQDYALQYNAIGKFNSYAIIKKDYRRRHLDYYQYIYEGLNTVQGITFNNYKRENSVYLKLHEAVANPKKQDNTRQTLKEFGSTDIFSDVSSTASAFYVAVKRTVRNAYGQLDSIEYLDTGALVTPLKSTAGIGIARQSYESGPVFGGDTFINKMSIKKTHHFFSQYLRDVTPGYIYDYRNYRNIGYPRFWMDSTPFDLSEVVSKVPSQSSTPKNKHNLEVMGSSSLFEVKNQYFYLFNSGVSEFFCESDFNLDFRDWKTEQPYFYSDYSSDLSKLFRSDLIEKREDYVYDPAYSKEITENSILPQDLTYDPSVDETCHTYIKNRVIYSQPASKEQRSDHWLIYLTNNFYDFSLAEFGNLTAINALDNQQVIFLFDKASPYVTVGRDLLRLDGSGRTVTVGDGGMFAQEPRQMAFTDYYYGNSQSKWAFVSSHVGSFYPSQRQGRIFVYGNGLKDISLQGMSYWFKNYLPSQLLKQFPDFKDFDNPLTGVGLNSIFDNRNEVYYLTKKDYKLKDEWLAHVTYSPSLNAFFVDDSSQVYLSDAEYFDDASWTVSYDVKQGSFISFHDWHPDWLMQGETHFLSIKDNAIWKHNEATDSFCSFYGVDYPFEIEYIINNQMSTQILRSIEYYLEVGKYFNAGKDFHQILDANFDYMMVHNNEQHSGLLHLNLQSKKDLSSLFNYPRYNAREERMEILFNKEEQTYRVNQFTDLTRDRGEFTKNNYPFWTTDANGYTRSLNPISVDYAKPVQHQKKFRSVWHKVLFQKYNCEDKKYIFKFANNKQSISAR